MEAVSDEMEVTVGLTRKPVDFNGMLFYRLVDYATVYPDGRVVFTFRNGAEVSTTI